MAGGRGPRHRGGVTLRRTAAPLLALAAVLAAVGYGLADAGTSAPAQDTLQRQFVQVVRTVSPSVVQIESGAGLGSGVVYDRNGHIVTNAHVVGTASNLRVTLPDGRRASGTLVGRFAPEDLAVIRVQLGGLRPVPLKSSSSVNVGDFALAIGNPLGLRSSVTDGIVSGVARTVSAPNGAVLPNVVQTSAPINPGNSGGALVDLAGRLIGIPTLGVGGGDGIGFAIASDRVKLIADQLIGQGRVVNTGRAFLGIRAGSLGEARGVLVVEAVEGGPAHAAGIRPGDAITALGGRPTPTPAELLSVLASRRPGDTVAVAFTRGGGTRQATVTLGELPATQG
jgi:putative serine protease PepD